MTTTTRHALPESVPAWDCPVEAHRRWHAAWQWRQFMSERHGYHSAYDYERQYGIGPSPYQRMLSGCIEAKYDWILRQRLEELEPKQ